MAKKTKVTQRAREEQWRRRVEQQSRQGVDAPAPVVTVDDDLDDLQDEPAEYIQADIQPMPSGVATSARTTTPTPARTPRTTTTSPTAARRATATRASRLAFQQTMSLEEEMNYVRSDIRQLIILTGLCLAVLIALSFVIN